MTLVRNENYWLWETEGKPYVDTIIMRWIESREVGKQLIQTGELDFVWDLIEADIPEAETWEGVVVSMPPSTGTERLLLNLVDPELDAPCAEWLRENPSPALGAGRPQGARGHRAGHRQADHRRQAAVRPGDGRHHGDEPGLGRARHPGERVQPGEGHGPAGGGGLDRQDGDGVRECNGCAYAEDGRVLKLKIQTTSGNALREQAEQVIMEMMADIGIEMYIENVPSAELFGSYSSGAFRKHGQFDILMYTTSYGTDPHSQMDGYYASYNISLRRQRGHGL